MAERPGNLFSTDVRQRAGSKSINYQLQPSTRLNTADIILAASGQSSGRLRFDDFTPLPCGDPNCAAIGYLLKIDGQIRSVSDFIDFKNVQGFLGTQSPLQDWKT